VKTELFRIVTLDPEENILSMNVEKFEKSGDNIYVID